MTDRILRRKAVLEILGISSSTLHRRIKEGSIDAPLLLGPNSVGWRASYLLSVLERYEVTTKETMRVVAPGARRGRKAKNEREVA